MLPREARSLLEGKIVVNPPLPVIIFFGDTLLRFLEDYTILLFAYELWQMLQV